MRDRDLKGLFEALTPAEDHKDKLLSRIMAASGERRRRTRRPLRTALAAVAVLVCLFATTAFSAAYLGLDSKWFAFLGLSGERQERELANGAFIVDKTISNENGTLRVQQILGDSNLLYVLMDFVAPEGTVLDKARYRFHGSLRTQGMDSSGIGFESLEDDNPRDNKISLVMSVSTNRIEAGREATLTVEDLQEADPYPDEYKEIVQGKWETTFNLNYKDRSKRYEFGKPIELYGHKATLEAMSVSPISITLFLRSLEVNEIFEGARQFSQEREPNVDSDEYPVTIRYKDGSSESTSVFVGMAQGHPTEGDIMVVKPFLPILEVERIESIEFFGSVVPIGE